VAVSGDHHPVSLEDLEAWAERELEERMGDLRLVALIHWVHDLAGFKF
jgi:hypothetical protein